MRLPRRIRPFVSTGFRVSLLATSLLLMAAPAWAGSGLAISLENIFVPMGKRVEKVYDGVDSTPPVDENTPGSIPPAGTIDKAFGRETTEWFGLSGFIDLNRNWRLLGGAHTTLLGNHPLFKFDGALAFVLEMPDTVPLLPYFYIGATPVLSAHPDIPTFGFNLHSGVGVDVLWNNTLYTSVRANLYMLSIYGEKLNLDAEGGLGLHWQPASWSISAGMGYLF